MQIAVKSASASVTRMLETLITRSGHDIARGNTTADVIIEDTIHPVPFTAGDVIKLQLVEPASAHEGAMPCPLRPERLIQRLAMLGTTQSITLGNGWTLDMLARNLHHTDGSACALTEKECSLLKRLAQSHPAPMGRDELLGQVWGVQGDVDTHTLETHIYRLRAKLNELLPNPCDIVTQGGTYALVFGPNPD